MDNLNIVKEWLMNYLNKAKDWSKDRLGERTSWDGGIIIAGSLAIIFLGGVVKVAAWFALAYGIWTVYKEEMYE